MRGLAGAARPQCRVRSGSKLTSVVALLAVGASAGVLTWPAQAASAPEPDAVATLQRAAEAARNQPYVGTQFLSAWSRGTTTSVLVDVTHVPGRGSLVRVAPNAGSVGASVLESDAGAGAGADSDPAAPLPGLDAVPLALLQANYDVSMGSPQSCVGRSAQVVDVRRRGADSSLAGRFWVDTATGLVLRREVFDAEGRTVRASAFVNVDTDAVPRLADAVPPVSGPATGKPVPAAELDRMRAAGWAAPARVGSDLALYDARSTGSGRARMLHLSYSDGLSTVSLFEQPGRLDPAVLRGWQQQRIGATEVYVRDTLPQRVAWSGAGTVYTLVADAPAQTVDAVVAALPAGAAPAGGLRSRIAHGLARLGSWLNPFG